MGLAGLSLKGEMDRAVDGGLEALLRRSEALRAGGLEQDRSRLLTVASRLVELGAQACSSPVVPPHSLSDWSAGKLAVSCT